MTESLIKTIVICIFAIIVIVLAFYGFKKFGLKNIKVGKSGLEIEGDIRQKNVFDLYDLLKDEENKLYTEVRDFCLKSANSLHDNFLRYLDKYTHHMSEQRVIAATIRFTLRNQDALQFPVSLRPENFKNFIDGVINDIRIEYETVIRDQKYYECPLHGGNCFQYPLFGGEFKVVIRERVIWDWAMPIRKYQIRILERQRDLCKKFMPSFAELENFALADKIKNKMDKVNELISLLSRVPNDGEL